MARLTSGEQPQLPRETLLNYYVVFNFRCLSSVSLNAEDTNSTLHETQSYFELVTAPLRFRPTKKKKIDQILGLIPALLC